MDDLPIVNSQSDRDNRSKLLITVAICTYNRADRLTLALDALSCQTLPSENFEILVVDNASTDNTKQICEQYQESLANLHYIYEPIQGLSKARNTGLDRAKSEYIAYLDDDAIPCNNWLEAILQTFNTVIPSPVGIGGPILPLWEDKKPEWMQDEMRFLFSILDCGDLPHWLKFPQFPFGANMSYQKNALIQIGGFCESLGRKGHNLLSCEEYLLNKTLTRQGGRFYYNPQAVVQHWIPQVRTQTKWLISRSYWQGRSEAVVDRMVGKSLKRQWWDSIGKFINFKRLVALIFPQSQTQIAARAWISRTWGYFFHVWFRQSQSIALNEQLKQSNPKQSIISQPQY